MRIKHVNGDYWSAGNNHFGHVLSSTNYSTVEQMPELVENNDGRKLERVIHCTGCAMYYPVNDYNSDALAHAAELCSE